MRVLLLAQPLMSRAANRNIKTSRCIPLERYFVHGFSCLVHSWMGGIAGNRYTFRMCREVVDESILVTEQEIYRAMAALLRDEGIVAEGGAAVGYAALLSGELVVQGPTAVVISGRNVDPSRLCDIVAGKPVQVGDLRIQGT